MTVRLDSIPNHRELRRLRAEASAAGEKLFPPGSRARREQAAVAVAALASTIPEIAVIAEQVTGGAVDEETTETVEAVVVDSDDE